MKIHSIALLVVLSLAIIAEAQVGQRGRRPAGAGGGIVPQPRFGESMSKVFSEHPAFTANMLMETKAENEVMTMPGKLAYLNGKARFEMDMTKIKGGGMPPETAQQMKEMGMGEMVSITRPDKNETYLIYPGLKAYAVTPTTNEKPTNDTTEKAPDIKKTEIGKETVDGHPCKKYKMIVKDDEGKEHEMTVWTASDLKDFPIKMQMQENQTPVTMTYRDVKLEKPDESLFEPPAGFQRYIDVGTLMRESMMKRFAPGGGVPPRQ